MIPNLWYVILESKEVRHGKPVGVTRMGEKLIPGDAPVIEYRRRRQALIDGKGSPETKGDEFLNLIQVINTQRGNKRRVLKSIYLLNHELWVLQITMGEINGHHAFGFHWVMDGHR